MIAMDFSADIQTLAADLVKALTGLVKLTKALSFYPADHPSLAAAAEETCKDFQPLLEHRANRPYHVTKDGFSLNDTPLSPNNKILSDLSLKLVARRVRHLLFLPELSKYELLVFADYLSKPADELLMAGGLPQLLADKNIKAIWLNEPNLDTVLKKLQDLGIKTSHMVAKPPGTELTGASGQRAQDSVQAAASQAATAGFSLPNLEQPPSNIEQMREHLEQLKEPQDAELYQELLAQVRQLAPAFFAETGIAGYLAVFSLLESHRKDSTRKASLQQATEQLIDQLLTERTKTFLSETIADPKLKASHRRALGRLLIGLEKKIAPQLLKRLYAERDAIIRRQYTAILARMGENIFELLRGDLQSDVWHRVRNVVTILGETRLDTALPLLTQALGHPEVRVRRSVIRALGAIGSNSVIPLLLRLGQDDNKELHQPAIMALGALKNPRAIPPLVELLKKSDLLGKKTRFKTEVIQALAATKSPQAIIPLLKLARRANLLNRNNIEVLRAEAIIALGQLGNSQLIPVLDQLPKSDKGPVSRALKQAKAQLQKQQHVV